MGRVLITINNKALKLLEWQKKLIEQFRKDGIITISIPPTLDIQSKILWIKTTKYNSSNNDICIVLSTDETKEDQILIKTKENDKNAKDLGQIIKKNQKTPPTIEIEPINSKHDISSLFEETDTINLLLEGKSDNFQKLDISNLINSIKEYISKIKSRETKPESNIKKSPTTSRPTLKRETLSKEERREMIISTYEKILGRKPSVQDANYFVNMGISEDDLIKRMVKSKDHAEMVRKVKEYEKIKKEYEIFKLEIKRLKSSNKDNKVILQNLRQLLDQKNQYIKYLKMNLYNKQNTQLTQSKTKKNTSKSMLKKFIPGI